MVNGGHLLPIVRQSFEVSFRIIVTLPDSAKSRNPQGTELNDVGGTQVVDVWGDPSTIVKLEQMIASLVIASDEDGQVGSSPRATVVLMKICHSAVLLWHRRDVEIVLISHGLESNSLANLARSEVFGVQRP